MNTENTRTRDLNRVLNRRRIINLTGLAAVNLLISLWMGQQAYRWLPPQASAESVLVDKLFSFMTAVGCFIFIGVVGTLLYSMVFHRAAKYDTSDGPPIEGNVKLEIVWTAVPIILIIWIGTVSFNTYDQMSILGAIAPVTMKTVPTVPLDRKKEVLANPNPTDTSPPIEVNSRQWAWEFYYPDEGISSTELHLPVNQRARFKLTSEDVLHGFYIPAFRVKQDIIPGRAIDFSFTPIREGRYRLRDSEFSGTYFAANQTNVVVESEAAFQQWLTTAAASPAEPAENAASKEFTAAQNSGRFRWKTVKPAPAPTVNYTSSEKDSYE
ncbi:MAG: alternative cytochrome c oxidase subunit II CtaCII [Phormidesmis priestleyi Ana]|uniref:Cytochrome c oxidase subunit 2 n=1 Tax=Phormidesmis priestleyi Ana TaxID=1666911 RepID=A0A0P7ZWM5_9CYAN|nr:MAG: alternative cytochrome c oxidase subunit II CtaCII [Phormidesmis priestleyi Ana]